MVTKIEQVALRVKGTDEIPFVAGETLAAYATRILGATRFEGWPILAATLSTQASGSTLSNPELLITVAALAGSKSPSAFERAVEGDRTEVLAARDAGRFVERKRADAPDGAFRITFSVGPTSGGPPVEVVTTSAPEDTVKLLSGKAR